MTTTTANAWKGWLIWRGSDVRVVRLGGAKKKPPGLGSSRAVLCHQREGIVSTGDFYRFTTKSDDERKA